MYSYINSIGLPSFLKTEALPMGLSLVIAQLFYHFGSFVAELGCFLLTWYLLSYLATAVKR